MDTIKTIVRKRYYMVMTGLLCAVALFFLLSTAIQSQRLVGAQHPGFLVFNNGLVFGLVDSSWNGNRAGLRMYDFIKGYDGHPFTGTKGLIDYINQKAPDGQVQYLVTRNHQDITLAIKPMAIDQNFANLYFYIFLFCGFLTLLTGLGIFIIRPLAKGAFHFFVICNTVSIFEILFADMMTYQTFLPYLQIIIALYGIVNIHTLYFMLRMREHLHVRLSQLPVKIVLGGVYVALVAFALLVNLYSDRMFADYRVLLFASNFLFFIGGVLIYLTTAYLYFSAKSSTAKRRLLLYMALNLSCFIGFAVYVAHNVCALLLPIELILLQLAFPFLTTYLLFKYNFLDLKFTPRRKYFYLGFAVLLPMLFVVDFVFLIPILNKYQVAVSWVLPLVTASVVIKLMLLVGAAYLRIVDRLFFPSTFKFRD
ncbi:MAG TPA: hypothetical protein VJC18_01225, partial [bacterium]|nr:hypothetical protein [bacterium]